MKDSYTKKEAIEILERALSKKDQETEISNDLLTSNDLEKMGTELNISRSELEQAATEITNTREQNRNEMYPEVVTTRWVNGKLTDEEIENLLSDLRFEVGGAKTWDGSPIGLHKIGKTWEYKLKDATVLINEENNGYQLQVIKSHFFHGNNLETSILAIPVTLIISFLPVAVATEWIHIYAAIFTAAVIYFFSYSLVKKYTNNKRSETVSKLLQITEYAEQKLRKMIEEKQSRLETNNNQVSKNKDLPQESSKSRLQT